MVRHPKNDFRGSGLDLGRSYDVDELFRQSPALQVADQILGNFSRPEEERPSVADLFIANTYQEGNRYRGRLRKKVDDAMMRYRIEMKNAHRFVLDDQFVEYATHAASVGAKKILNRIHAATLPYEQTWIEFNLHKKVETIRKIHKVNDNDMTDIAPRMGCLLQRINDTDMVCTMVPDSDERPLPHLTAYFVSTREIDFFQGDTIQTHYGCRPFDFHWDRAVVQRIIKEDVDMSEDEFREGMRQVGKATLWGYTKGQDHGMLPKQGKVNLAVPEPLLHHGDAGYSRMYDALNDALREARGEEGLFELVAAELREYAGQIRWLVTILAMLNEVPIHADLVQRPHHIRISPTRKRQFVDYHKVSLKIPKIQPIRFIERKLSHAEAARRRAHQVRAHWRYYLKEGYCRRDEHEWVWDEENGYRLCGKCFSFATLIHEHVRGDPSLGWVRKDYIVERQRRGQ